MQKSSLTLLHVLRRGDLLPSRNERSGLKLDRAMVANVVKLKLSRCVSAAAPQIFKFAFLGCGSRWVKFEAEIYKFDFEFKYKTIKRKSWDDFSSFLLRKLASCKQKKQNWACTRHVACGAKILQNLGKVLTRRAVWRKIKARFFLFTSHKRS